MRFFTHLAILFYVLVIWLLCGFAILWGGVGFRVLRWGVVRGSAIPWGDDIGFETGIALPFPLRARDIKIASNARKVNRKYEIKYCLLYI